MSFTKEQVLDAIKKSIQHWKRMRDWAEKQNPDDTPCLHTMSIEIGECPSSNHCALCQLVGEPINCKLCPIYQYNPDEICEKKGSRYMAVIDADTLTYQEWVEQAEEMIDFLDAVGRYYKEPTDLTPYEAFDRFMKGKGVEVYSEKSPLTYYLHDECSIDIFKRDHKFRIPSKQVKAKPPIQEKDPYLGKTICVNDYQHIITTKYENEYRAGCHWFSKEVLDIFAKEGKIL